MNVVIACGGTGGHLFPGLAVAEVLQSRGHDSLIFISQKDIDAQAVRDYTDRFRFEKLPSIGLPRTFSPAMLVFASGFVQSMTRVPTFLQGFQTAGCTRHGWIYFNRTFICRTLGEAAHIRA